MSFKKLKGVFNQASLITICGSPVKININDSDISLHWTGTVSGQKFSGKINEECLKGATVSEKGNVLNSKLYWTDQDTQTTKFSKELAPITFWHKIEMPII